MKKDIAVEMFKSGFNCGQAVFSTFSDECDECGLSRDLACKLATGLGGGVARHGEICGAVSGAVLALSASFGRGENDPKENMELTYSKTQELIRGFKEKMGTVSCKELLHGCDLLTSDGMKKFVDKKYGSTVCIPSVEAAVEVLEPLMKKEEL